MSNYRPGLCRRCDQTEQVCARDAGCCEVCTHWDHLDENGNDKAPRVQVPAPRSVCVERVVTVVPRRDNGLRQNAAPAIEAATSAGAATEAPEATGGSAVPFSPAITTRDNWRCTDCGRLATSNRDGTRRRHRVEADNPLAEWCPSSGRYLIDLVAV